MHTSSEPLAPPRHPVFQTSSEAVCRLLADTPLRGVGPVLGRWFQQDLERLTARAVPSAPDFLPQLLESLKLTYACGVEDIQRIPASGPLVVVANHPFGLAEGPILWAILSRVRSDVKFLANSMLAEIPALRECVIPVDPFGGPAAVRANWKSLREAIDWLRRGNAIVMFPAGEVASVQWTQFQIADPVWNDKVARIVQLTNAVVLPVFFHGSNGPVFHLAGLIHPLLRTVLMPRELLNKGGRTIQVSIGTVVRQKRLRPTGVTREITGYLRARTMLLGNRRNSIGKRFLYARMGMKPSQAAIAANGETHLLQQEIAGLPAENKVVASGEYLVSIATPEQIPHILYEIGRLREITFRQAGEGTGQAIDLDSFDRHYHHLFLWNQDKQELVGAYRFARTDQVVALMGLRGLYTNTLFRLSQDFHATTSPALELGRSFVRAEYQKSYLPLLLLWKGIGQFVAAHPQYRYLFGPVSISQRYTPSSQALMVSFLKSRCGNAQLAAHVQPRRKYRIHSLRDFDPTTFSTLLTNVDELSEVVAELEPDRKGVPILVQQYLNLGGTILDFSVDPNFSNVLDGLVVVDLAKTDARLLERFLGKSGRKGTVC